jgi:hypothetical protein
MDVGESLVGAYMHQVRGCHTVAYNTFLPTGQGELDVVVVAKKTTASKSGWPK